MPTDEFCKRPVMVFSERTGMKKIKEIFSYRDMIRGLVKRDLRGRYKGSVLGFLWNFVNPLCQIIVYSIVFSNILKNDIEKYPIFLIIGLMPWNFFAESLTQGSGCILHQADLTKKIYFPREVLPISTVISRFINLLITMIIMFAIILISGVGIKVSVLVYLPIVMLVEIIMALGFTLLLSAIDVYFRDVEYMTGVVMMAWVWVTPIMYSFSSLSGTLASFVAKNPMTPVICAYQSILYYHVAPDMVALGKSALFSLVVLGIGAFVFRKLEGHFAELL